MKNNLPIILKELAIFSDKDADANIFTENYECFGVSMFGRSHRMRGLHSSPELEIKEILSENCKPNHVGDYKYVHCENCPMDCSNTSLNYIK